MRNLIATFYTNVYSKKSNQSRKGFQFPKELAELFGWKRGRKFRLPLTITKL